MLLVPFGETKGTPAAGEQFKYIVKCKSQGVIPIAITTAKITIIPTV